MGTLRKDLRQAVRAFARTPLITGAVLLSLALGIGANTTIFTLVNAVLLRGLPIADPERVTALFTVESPAPDQYLPVSHPNFTDLRERADAFSDLVAVIQTQVKLTAGEVEPEVVAGELVDGPYFEMLGLQPAVGRFFAADEVAAGGPPVVVLRYGFWQRRFGGDRTLIGRTVRLNDQTFTVVGVAPQQFQGLFIFENPDFWAPVAARPSLLTGFVGQYFDSRRALVTVVYGRLRDGVSLTRAQTVVRTVGQGLQAEFPGMNKNRNFAVLPVSAATIYPTERAKHARAGALLMGVVALTLLIACFNVANLQLSRAVARRREIALRLALGASRGRILRQLMTEGLLLAFTAGGLGLLVALWAPRALWAHRPPLIQAAELDFGLDLTVLGFTLGLSLLTALLCGLAPALRASRPEIAAEIRNESGPSTGGNRLWSLKNFLVAAQVALAFVALTGAGLFLRSLGEATRIDLGFKPEGLALLRFDLALQGYEGERLQDFLTRAVEAASRVPGVAGATVGAHVPLVGGGTQRTILPVGGPGDLTADEEGHLVPVNTVDAGFFQTLGIALRRGRDFNAFDRAETELVAIVNDTMAERFWPGADALDQRLRFIGPGQPARRVVGVVADTRYFSVGEDPQPQLYLPRRQQDTSEFALLIRAAADPAPLLAPIREELRQLEPNLPVTDVRTFREALRQALWAPRMAASLLGAMGALALLLAAVGLYATMSYAVQQRRHEIGIRMAVGARGSDVLRLILTQGLTLLALGLLTGLAAALLAGPQIAPLLYRIRPTDPATLFTTAAVLTAVALLATLLPAWRATSVDPVRVLRKER